MREGARRDGRDLRRHRVPRAPGGTQRSRSEGISVEILDLRSLSPVDWDAIAASVRKTSKVLVLTEDSLSLGYGAEIAARIGETLYTELDGPVRRLAATDTFVGYAPELEDFILPQVADIAEGGGGAGGLVGPHFSSLRSIQPSSAAASPVTVPV